MKQAVHTGLSFLLFFLILGLYMWLAPSDTYPFNDSPSKQNKPHTFPWWSVYHFELYSTLQPTQHDADGDGRCRHRGPVCTRFLYDLEMDSSCGERKSGVISPAG